MAKSYRTIYYTSRIYDNTPHKTLHIYAGFYSETPINQKMKKIHMSQLIKI